MPVKFFTILLTALLLSFQVKGQLQGGSVLERRVSINEKNQALRSILDQLSWQAGVFFSYDASVIDAEKKYTLEKTNKSLFSILNELFDYQNYNFTELDNQIILTKRKQEKTIIPAKDTIPEKFFFISGKIVDNKKYNPIKYASVSVWSKPIGTISNQDGEFLLKLHPENILDTIIISCMGYSQMITTANSLLDEDLIVMNPVSIRIREVKVTAITPHDLLANIRDKLEINYSNTNRLMNAFYRETTKQNNNYINISEAVVELLKAPYVNAFRDDLVRVIKGRRSPDVRPFQWLNFKLQGGPYTITKLDVVKTMENFIDEKSEDLYKYNISKVIRYKDHPVYVLEFHPASNMVFPGFTGELYVHRETFAIVHASFKLNKNSLKDAENTMIKKKPRGVRARPSHVHYLVNYRLLNGKWHLHTARADVKFKIRSRREKLNSEFHSVSEILITDIQNTDLKRFHKKEQFTQRDIFVEIINEYDEEFWENYNIIKPNENLRKAFKNNPE